MENLTKKELLMISNCIIRAMTEIRESKKVLDFYNIPSDDNALLEYEQLNYKVLDLIPESKEDWNMVTRAWKIYGAEGHRQRESFNESYDYDFSNGDDIRLISVENSDKTNTNDYTIVRITRNTSEECESELWGQITDGIFENSRTGKVEEIF